MKQLNSSVLNVTVAILDFLYRNRPAQRFWVLEVIARAPYFAFISVLHLRESLGLRGEEHIYLMKEHFYQALNETENHLKKLSEVTIFSVSHHKAPLYICDEVFEIKDKKIFKI